MIRAITASATYQLTSEMTHESQDTPNVFAVMPVRAMTPEQIFDSLAQATYYPQPFNPEEAINFNNDEARQEFLDNFRNDSDPPTERATTILQALQVMNGGFVADATHLVDSQTLAGVLDARFLDTAEKIEVLFFATLSRRPMEDELNHFQEYVESGGPMNDQQAALSDVFWALLNSSEFMTKSLTRWTRWSHGEMQSTTRHSGTPVTPPLQSSTTTRDAMNTTRRDMLRMSAAGFIGGSMCQWFPALADDAASNPAIGSDHASCCGCRVGRVRSIHSIRSRSMRTAANSNRSIPRFPGIQICEHLPGVAQQMENLAIVRSMTTKEGDHTRATYLAHTGIPASGSDSLSNHGVAAQQGTRV